MRWQFLWKVAVFCGGLASAAVVSGSEPNWYGRVILPTPQRQQIEATPIVQRPYRPLHVYGNTVRRRHYRGRTLPTVRDFARGTAAWLRRD